MTNSGKRLHVLISGASIGGPALAYWLHRYGCRVTIVEKAPALRKGGYRVDIRGKAVTVAEKMGILPQVKEKAIRLTSSSLVNSRGKVIAEFNPDLFGMRQQHDIEILRGDLAHILYAATRDDTEYIFRDSITAMREHASGVTVSFVNGPDREFDLVVGADGLRSNVRRLLYGADDTMVHHLGYYIAIFSVPPRPGLELKELGYPMPGKLINLFNTHRGDSAKALFIFTSPELQYDHKNTGQQQRILADAFRGEGWHTPALLEAMETAPDFYFDAISQVHVPRLFRSRVVLLGDAGYCPSPASGQGTSLALTGAYVLAGELVKAGGDHTKAFTAYERQMRGYITANQQLGITVLDQMITRTKKQLLVQAFVLRVLLILPWKNKLIKKMMTSMQQKVDAAANAISLEEYDNVHSTVQDCPGTSNL